MRNWLWRLLGGPEREAAEIKEAKEDALFYYKYGEEANNERIRLMSENTTITHERDQLAKEVKRLKGLLGEAD